MNKTTTITLNDRFSMIKQTSNQPRGRSRSRSRSMNRRQPSDTQLRGSRKNQKLLDQLEKQHKMRLAMKLKNKSILRSRGGRVQSRVQGRVQGQIVRNGLKRAATVKKNNQRNFKRSNSMTTFVPLKDTPGTLRNNRARSRSRSRNRSQTRNITERLGIRQPRRRMRRGAAQSNGGQQQQQTQQQGGRSRSRSRVRLNRNNFNNRNNNNQAQSKRSNSVNNRLGNSGPTRAQSQRGRRVFNNQRIGTAQMNRGPIAGRIVKRQKNLNAGGRIQKLRKNGANTLGAQATRGRVIKRGGRAGLNSNRGRSQQRGNRTQQQQNKNGPARRGRSRTRRGGSAQNQNTRGGKSQISKEQLDKQLDDYMSKGSA